MGRATSFEVKRVVDAAKTAGSTVTAVLTLQAVGLDKTLRFNAVVTITVDGTPTDYTLCSTSTGSVKRYSEADAAVKEISKILPSSTGSYTVQVEVGSLLDVNPPANLVNAQTAEKVKLTAKLTGIDASIAKAAAELALMVGWDSGNSLQVARFGEATARKNALEAYKAAVVARIAELP